MKPGDGIDRIWWEERNRVLRERYLSALKLTKDRI